MLDQISGGRLEIGFGRGASLIELAIYGEDPDAAQDIYTEGLELILKGLTREAARFSRQAFLVRRCADGRSSRCKSRIRRSGTASMRRTAPSARPSAISMSSASIRRPTRGCRSSAIARRGGRRIRAPRCPSSASAASSLSARPMPRRWRLARRAYPIWHQSFTYLFRLRDQPQIHPRPADFDALMQRGQGVAGSPATVTDFLKLRSLRETQCNYVVGQFAFGDMTREEALGSIGSLRQRRHAGSCSRRETEALIAAR